MADLTKKQALDIIEQIASEWDACEFDAPGGNIDIGDAIRRAGFAKINAAAGVQGTRKAIACIGCGSVFDAYAFGTNFPACCPSCGEAGSEPMHVAGRSGSWWHDRRKTRDVAGILRFLTPQQMAEEIVRLDAVIAGQPNIQMGRVPAGVLGTPEASDGGRP